jgi:CRISPR-associated endonuclease Csy4
MDHYLDLRIRPDPEFSVAQLMSVLFQKLHLTLVDLRSTDVGISFPEFKDKPPTLGACLRLHARAERLQAVIDHPHWSGLKDHLEIGRLAPVPAQVQYRVVSRAQAKSNPERLLRRQMRRHGYASMEEARQAAIESAMARHGVSEQEIASRVDRGQMLSEPCVSVRSHSTGQAFRLFIKHGALRSQPSAGEFNSYGLGVHATVPWF